ncbi:LLM class flavin-dependent oxidoreductase [Natrononativus amylolyticus]|uniref:LLM class flavin-dependent oxidoreductase n=1 Tax=Natrononativus amylolyticus TaxID=2963434 RepID=UPI003CE5298D
MNGTPRGLLLPDTETRDSIEYGVLAEDLGYDSAWMVELWENNAFVELGILADRTTDINLGTAIVNVFSRSPGVLAMGAASLQRYSDGRFFLGTGVSTPKVIEDLHGIKFERPVRRAHETIEVVDAYLDGDGSPVLYENELLEVADFPSLNISVPIFHAALGSANRRVVGRLADGWIPHNVPFSYLTESFATIAEAARERGRDPDEITVSPYVPVAVADDVSVAEEAVRRHLAYNIGNAKGYENAVALSFPEEAQVVADFWRKGDRSSATAAVTDEMIVDLGIVGTPDTAPEKLETLLDARDIIDFPILAIPRQCDEELTLQTIEAMAP